MDPVLGLFIPVPNEQALTIIAAFGAKRPAFAVVPEVADGPSVVAETAEMDSRASAKPARPTAAPLRPLTRVQAQIAKALSRQPPLNDRQVGVLTAYWHAYHETREALPIGEVAARVARSVKLDPIRAEDFVKGSLRSFGKRLSATVDEHLTWKRGVDRHGDGVADPVPLIVLFDIMKGPNGEACHRLTNDGEVAVAAVLGLSLTEAEQEVEGEHDKGDSDEMVTLAMKRRSAALIRWVAASRGITVDEAVRQMAAAAGAA